MVGVSKNGMRDLALENLAGGKPRIVAEKGIRAHTDQRNVVVLKIFQQLLETCDFGGSYERKIERVEVQNAPLPLDVCAAELLLLPVMVGSGCPLRGGLANKTHVFLLR